MVEPLRLSTLGRSVTLGDFYDYTCDKIISSGILDSFKFMKKDNVSSGQHSAEEKFDITFVAEPSDEIKWINLKFSSHLKASILANMVEQIWCSRYLFENETHDKVCTSLAVHLTYYQRVETCQLKEVLDYIKFQHPQSLKLVLATHIVTGVTYGFNVVFVFKVPFSSSADKILVDNQLFMAVKKAFSILTKNSSLPSAAEESTANRDIILERAKWCLYTDLKWSGLDKTNFSDCLKSLVHLHSQNHREHFVPIEVTLCSLTRNSMGGMQVIYDAESDIISGIVLLRATLHRIRKTCQHIVQDPSSSAIPHLGLRLEEFQKCLQVLHNYLCSKIQMILITYRKFGRKYEAEESFRRLWKIYLSGDALMEWLFTRQQELFVFSTLLQNLNIPWKLEGQKIKAGHVEVFIFKTKEIEDRVISNLKNLLKFPVSGKLWTTFEIFSSSKQCQDAMRTQLLSFCEHVRLCGCVAYLACSNIHEDGTVESFNRPYTTSLLPKPFHPPPLTAVPVETLSSNFTVPNEVNQEKKLQADDDIESLDMETPVIKVSANFDHESVESTTKGAYDDIYKMKSFDSLAQEFVKRSQLVKKGPPSVYQLVPDERTSKNKTLRWFDIGKPLDLIGTHKIVMLMGASGCGKSTLINGIVNYILGVEWTDLFRFRMVNDENPDKNKAHSQTSSVTAYTIHRMEGMKIPYGLTIIDTPGFGDTGGVKSDQEITRIIFQFLTHPETIKQLDFVSAVCFVASSADSRLTATQEYILKTVASIFGKDVRNNLRLLVTFSDGMKPPVLEAIRVAAITGLSDETDGTIRHQKFNSSALYAANVNDDLFNKIFWEMGHFNFQSFFKMLAEMPNQSLKQTQEVVNSRIQLEKNLEDVEKQLEIVLGKIESIGKFKKILTDLGNRLDVCKNYEIEVEEWIVNKIPCLKNGTWSYNCRKCLLSCERSFSYHGKKLMEFFGGRTCYNSLCSCPGEMHGFDQFEYEKKLTKIKKTIQLLKEEYDKNAGRILTVEELLVKCQEELKAAKQKGIEFLRAITTTVKVLENSALNSKTMKVSDYIEELKIRLEREKRPGYTVRLEILDQLLRLMILQQSPCQKSDISID